MTTPRPAAPPEVRTGESLTQSLRRRVLAGRSECPTCHQPTVGGGVRVLAADMDIPHAVLWRFMRGGDMTGRNLDKVAAWLDSRPSEGS